MARLLALVAIIALLAILAPRFAPGLLAGLTDNPAEEVVIPAAAERRPAQRTLSSRRVALDADPRGHFLADVTVNGRRIEMMVDTGATIVALNETTARRLGIDPPPAAFIHPMSTANGTVKAALVQLAEIRLGGITVADVPAVVMPGKVLETNLLGMSFLGRLSSFEVADGQLLLVE